MNFSGELKGLIDEHPGLLEKGKWHSDYMLDIKSMSPQWRENTIKYLERLKRFYAGSQVTQEEKAFAKIIDDKVNELKIL